MDSCRYCGTEYNDERNENGEPFCECDGAVRERLEAELAALRQQIETQDIVLAHYQIDFDSLRQQNAAQKTELEKWRTWDAKGDLKDLREQAMDRNGEYKDSLCANHLYIGALEHYIKELEAYTNKLETAGQEVVRRGMRMKEKRTARTIGEFIKAFDYWGQVIYAGVEQAAIKGDELASEVKG